MRPKTKSGAIAIAALASHVVLFAHSSTAQEPTHQSWTQCELQENLADGGHVTYRSSAKAGEAPRPDAIWSSPRTSPIRITLHYVPNSPLGTAPIEGQATYENLRRFTVSTDEQVK